MFLCGRRLLGVGCRKFESSTEEPRAAVCGEPTCCWICRASEPLKGCLEILRVKDWVSYGHVAHDNFSVKSE